MKKLVKLLALALTVALFASVTACGLTEKTVERRSEYLAKAQEYVAELNADDYTAEDWADIETYLAEYELALNSVAAKSKMDVLLSELKLDVNAVLTISEHVDQYIENVDGRIADALALIREELDPVTMGISEVLYNEASNHATFYITDETRQIRKFADTGICTVFQNMFADVDHAVITTDTGASDVISNAMLTDPVGLKHHVGEHFIKLFVEDYAYAPLSHLVGHSASAEVYFKVTLNDGTVVTETATFSCSFIAA